VTTKLPTGWVETTIDDVCLPIMRIDPSRSHSGSFKYLDIGSINSSKQIIESPQTLKAKEAPSRARQVVATNDILFSTVRPYLRGIATVPAEFDGEIASTGFSVLRASHAVNPSFLFYWVTSNAFINRLLPLQRGSSYPAVRDEDVRGMSLFLPPPREQARIVAAIDELFERLDAAEAAIETASVLCGEFQAAALAATVKNASLGDPRFSSEDPWRIGTIGEVSTGMTPPTAQLDLYGGDLAFFKPTDLNQGYWVEHPRQTLSPKGAEVARLLPPKAVMVTCIGATIGKLGLSRVPSATNQQINSVVIDPSVALPEWLYWVLKSPYGQRQIIDNASATTLPLLNKSRFSEIPIPISSIQEQKEAVSLIEYAISSATILLSHVESFRDHLESLRQSILAAAFRGELVLQDPKDEPASVLLDRIRAHRGAAATAPKARKTVPPASAKRKHA